MAKGFFLKVLLYCCHFQIDQIYAQILYKDKLIVDLNNKILELDRKIIDLQEFAGEKNEVVKGRDKVIKVSFFCSFFYIYNLLYFLL